MKKNHSKSILLTVLCLLTSVLCIGCIRLSGGAGYYTQKNDEEPQVKKVGFDTANLNPNRPVGSITVADSN